MPRHRSSAVPLSWLYIGLIVYASLYPFAGWRIPGVSPLDFMLLGWPRWWTWFDLVSNLLGYLPLGFLFFVALVRSGRRGRDAALYSVIAGTLLSFAMETLQNYLPMRVSSNVDLALNSLGTAVGVGIGVALNRRGGIARWQKVRERWFVARAAGGFALLILWPIALLFPTAVPFGIGHVLDRLQPFLADLLQGNLRRSLDHRLERPGRDQRRRRTARTGAGPRARDRRPRVSRSLPRARSPSPARAGGAAFW